jgi:hypothetical protein
MTAVRAARTACALTAAALAAALAAGCGADTEETPSDFPAAEVRDGRAYLPAESHAEAKRLCDAAQADWPQAWADHPFVTFDIPDTDNDFSCVRPR